MCGTLVYNEIVIVPYFGFDKNTKVAREKRSRRQVETEGDDTTGYIAPSPHATYDASRNKRKVQMKVDQMRMEGQLNKSEITVEETSRPVTREDF